jgi:hypothetical protein
MTYQQLGDVDLEGEEEDHGASRLRSDEIEVGCQFGEASGKKKWKWPPQKKLGKCLSVGMGFWPDLVRGKML